MATYSICNDSIPYDQYYSKRAADWRKGKTKSNIKTDAEAIAWAEQTLGASFAQPGPFRLLREGKNVAVVASNASYKPMPKWQGC